MRVCLLLVLLTSHHMPGAVGLQIWVSALSSKTLRTHHIGRGRIVATAALLWHFVHHWALWTLPVALGQAAEEPFSSLFTGGIQSSEQ